MKEPRPTTTPTPRRKSPGHYIGHRLYELRTDPTPERTIEQMARMAGVSAQEWEAFESFGVIPEEPVWRQLQQHGIDICYVLTGEYLRQDELFADEMMLLSAYRKLESQAKEALCNLASSCLTADEIRHFHPLIPQKQAEAIDRHLHFNEVVGVVVHHNSGVINSNVSPGGVGKKPAA